MATSGEATKEEVLISVEEVGPIDTFSLLDPFSGNLRAGLLDGVDVVALSASSWGMLKDWSVPPFFRTRHRRVDKTATSHNQQR